MAKALFEHRYKNIKKFSIDSVGLFVMSKSSASKEAIETMASYGIDIKTHISNQITPDHATEAGLILTMTDGHKLAILNSIKQAEGKTYTLYEYVKNTAQNVSDPFGRGSDIYKETAEELDQLICELIKILQNTKEENKHG